MLEVITTTLVKCDHCKKEVTKEWKTYNGKQYCKYCDSLIRTEEAEEKLLQSIGLSIYDFGRFRHAFIRDGRIYAYSRIGGGNAKEYRDCFKTLRKNEYYDDDQEDECECTYHDFYFNLPEDLDISQFEIIMYDD